MSVVFLLSLSARRAWIEMPWFWPSVSHSLVALRKESVDRNLWWGVRKAVGSLSLSARRAWIEIQLIPLEGPTTTVALRKESVDRNMLYDTSSLMKCVALRKESVDRNIPALGRGPFWTSRSPQGERG